MGTSLSAYSGRRCYSPPSPRTRRRSGRSAACRCWSGTRRARLGRVRPFGSSPSHGINPARLVVCGPSIWERSQQQPPVSRFHQRRASASTMSARERPPLSPGRVAIPWPSARGRRPDHASGHRRVRSGLFRNVRVRGESRCREAHGQGPPACAARSGKSIVLTNLCSRTSRYHGPAI